MKNALLTIAILTWNRNGQVAKTVASFVPQLRSEVNIVVLDNCSDIPVETSMPTDLKRHVRIVRNVINIGAPANVLRCFEIADTDWIWIFGDDDEPASDAVDRALHEISSHPDCCLLDFGHPFKETRKIPAKTHSAHDAINSMYYPNGSAEIYAWSDGHVSNEILNRKLLIGGIQCGYKHIHTLYPHMAMIFSALSTGTPCLFTGPQLATCRVHEEAPTSYTHADITIGWKQLANLLTDVETREIYLAALNSSVEYGYGLIPEATELEGITKRVIRAVIPKPVRRVIANLRRRRSGHALPLASG